MVMTFADDKTTALWRSFMPHRKEIMNTASADLISMQVYNTPLNTQDFDIHALFEKWAAMEVADFNNVPEGMETFTIPAGKYAVFHHKGGPAKAREAFSYIFGIWLPASGYQLDHRPHFEVLGEKYKGNEPDSEEEIWIPVKKVDQ